MKKILLVCAAGMSTSLLVNKMKESAIEQGIEIDIEALPVSECSTVVSEEDEDLGIVNAGGQPVTILPGGVFFDSSTSFGIIRGGHIDLTVLGALQVDEKGNIANYMIPGKMVPGMGGAMDLLSGAKEVIVAMEHTSKGNIKILKECNLPLTAKGVVDKIITEMCVLNVTDNGLELVEINGEYTIEQIQEVTEAKLVIPKNLKVVNI